MAGMCQLLQQFEPDDYVAATGASNSGTDRKGLRGWEYELRAGKKEDHMSLLPQDDANSATAIAFNLAENAFLSPAIPAWPVLQSCVAYDVNHAPCSLSAIASSILSGRIKLSVIFLRSDPTW